MNILETFEKNQINELFKEKNHPDFYPGDTIKIHLKIKEGEKERIQIFEGICIARKNAGINSSFTVRKISYGEGVERVLPFYSPQIAKIEIAKNGDVRRSKLYYLRGRSGKSARISEKNKFVQQTKVNKHKEETKVTSKVTQSDKKFDNTEVIDEKKSTLTESSVSTEKS